MDIRSSSQIYKFHETENKSILSDQELNQLEEGTLKKGSENETDMYERLKKVGVVCVLSAGVISSTIWNPHSAVTGYLTNLFTAAVDPLPNRLGNRTRYCAAATLVALGILVDYSGRQFLPWEIKLTSLAGGIAIATFKKEIKAFIK